MALDLTPVNPTPKLDLTPVTPAPSGQPALDLTPVKKEEKSPSSWVWSDVTSNKEFDDIANKHGVSSQELKDLAGYFGASKENESIKDAAKHVLGSAAEALTYGVPQKIYKMLQTPEMERALDDLDRLAQEKKSNLRTLGELLGGFATGSAETKLLGKAAIPAIGAAAGFAHSRSGEEAQGAAIGAGLGAGLVGLGKAVPAAAKLIRPSTAATAEAQLPELLTKKMATEGKIIEAEQEALRTGDSQLLEPFTDPRGGESSAELASARLEQLRDDIAKRVGADSWEQAVKEHGGIKRLAEEVHPNLREEQLSKEIIEEEALGAKTPKISGLTGYALKLADNKPLMKIIDKRHGTNAEQMLDKISSNLAEVSPVVKSNMRSLEQINSLLKSKGITPEEFNTAYRSGTADPQLKQAWDDLTSSFLREVNQRGAGIEARAEYMRDQLLRGPELQAAIEEQASKLPVENIMDITKDEFEKLSGSSGTFKQLTKALDIITGKSSDTYNGFLTNMSHVLGDVTELESGLLSRASAARERLGQIPEFVLEKNPIKGMESWTRGVYKNLAVRQPVDRLRSIANIADKAGDNWTARHIRETIQDVLGGRKDTFAGASRNQAAKWTRFWTKKGYEGLAELPGYVNELNKQIYPNLVGALNAKASLQNLATPVLSIIPDIGLKAGTSAWWNATGEAAQLLAKRGLKGTEEFLASKGVIPAHAITPVEKQGVRGKLGRINDASNEALMSLFNLSELTARSQTYFMGQELGQKIAANPEWGAKFIQGLNSPSYRRTLAKALGEGNVDALKEQMSRFLNSNHLLNYDIANKSAFGRFIGPTFSVFTKWPSTMYGKVVQEVADKGAVQGGIEVARKIMTPVIALGIADRLTRGEEPSVRSKAILGTNLADMAPGSALKSVPGLLNPLGATSSIPGRLGTIITERTPAGSDGISHKLRKALNDSVSTFAPFAGWLRLFGSQLPTLITGRKQEGYAVESQIKNLIPK